MEAPPAFGFRSVSDRLGAWNFYFIAKLVLFALGLIGFHLVENLVFAAVLFAMAAPRSRRWRPWLGVPVAIALLYYDSWLPGFARVVSQAGLVASFSGAYLAELAGRFVNVKVIALLVAALAAYGVIARFVRLDVIVMAAMVAMAVLLSPPLAQAPAVASAPGAVKPGVSQNPDAWLAEFFRKEAQRAVAFARPPEGSPAFDVIFIHVCSLSWDDLEATGMGKHPLLASFDILMRRFNAVSTYSGPAVIRFLRASCGQAPHRALYTPALPSCLLLPGLAQAGFEGQLVLNHDGHFDDFLSHVRAQGIQAAPLPLKGVAAPLRAFDDSRIYDDGAVLARWLDARTKSAAPHAALYYNTVSLHDGNRLVRDPGTRSSETYKVRVAKLLDDVHGFVNTLAASGRRAIVVVVPEHGAAWRGDAAQIAGLREIPTPAITLVPVGIRVIGPDARRNGVALQVSESTSFLAVSHIVARMLAQPPFGVAGFRPADYTAGMPLTDFVSEGETAMLLRRGDAYLIRQEQEAWKELR
ncbi:MAG: cellulose biosynthesis protein BcsG [Usitatibacter sp.]